jgi:hypothetical protein
VLSQFRSIETEDLITSFSKLHIGYGVVRIPAGMVGILLNSYSTNEELNVRAFVER